MGVGAGMTLAAVILLCGAAVQTIARENEAKAKAMR